MPVPEWVVFLGKFLGLSLALFALMALVATVGVLGQMRMGYFHFELGAVPADPLWTSTRRVPPVRTARLRGTRGGESEARRLPRGADRIWDHRLSVHLRAGTLPSIKRRGDLELEGSQPG